MRRNWLLMCALVTANAAAEPARVPGGAFLMGTDPATIPALRDRFQVSRPGIFENETPARMVTLSPFRIDTTPVTNQRFAVFVRAEPQWSAEQIEPRLHNGTYLAHWRGGEPPGDRLDHPVVNVTWHAAEAFCRWSGGRLPTEAQWEFAARAGDERQFPWGNDLPSARLANYQATGLGSTSPVGRFPANPYGLHDLSGNTWEWLLDAWLESREGSSPTDPVVDPPGEVFVAVEGRRSVRGGSFEGAVVNLRSRWRDSHVVTNAVAFVGFRCAYAD